MYVSGHIPLSEYNTQIFAHASERAHYVVSIRSLPDLLVSYADHIQNSGNGPLDYRVPGLVECHPDWKSLEDREIYTYLIRMVLPWFLKMLSSVVYGDYKGKVDVVTFEEVVLKPVDTVKRLVRRIEGEHSSFTDQGVFSEHANFNKGALGRGLAALTQEQETMIRDLLESSPFHPGTCYGQYLAKGLGEITVDELVASKAEPEIMKQNMISAVLR